MVCNKTYKAYFDTDEGLYHIVDELNNNIMNTDYCPECGAVGQLTLWLNDSFVYSGKSKDVGGVCVFV
jgi:hypothetical protein